MTDGIWTTLIIPNSELTSSLWNKYVYRVYEGSHVDQSTCTAMCAFDYDDVDGGIYSYGCHFTVFDGTKCYLGSIGYEGDLIASITGNELHFKQSRKRNFHTMHKLKETSLSLSLSPLFKY